jgi:hypothetical protein
MRNDNADWQLDALGRQIGPRRGEILDLESRVNWSEQFVSQHEHDIRQTRYEVACKSAELEKRIVQLETQTKASEGLIVFLGEVLTALLAVLCAGLVAAYIQGDIYWKGGGAFFVFVAVLLMGQLVFRGLRGFLFEKRDQIRTTHGGKRAARSKPKDHSGDLKIVPKSSV